MTPALALDTSVAIPLLVQSHAAHRSVTRWWAGRELALSGHATAETYSVLTRLPGDLRLLPEDASRLMAARFTAYLQPAPHTCLHLPGILARAGIAGGAVYDALVALAAVDHDAELATRDARAQGTYERVGARVTVVV